MKAHRATHGAEVVTIYTPVYVVGHWWEQLLHNHKARRIRQKLMLVHGVTLALVPWLLDSSQLDLRPPLPPDPRPGPPRRAPPADDAAAPPAREGRRPLVRAGAGATASSRVPRRGAARRTCTRS